MNQHHTVLLQEAVTALQIKPDGHYIDGTYGRGGHSGLILQQLGANGSLLAVDKDATACEHARSNYADDTRMQIRQGSFADLPTLVQQLGWQQQVDGILLDLGVSSPQIDQAERGFSFIQDGPLDMRMNTGSGITAAEWLASASWQEIAAVLRDFGEERNAKRIARAISQLREDGQPLQTTAQLAALIARVSPSHDRHKHPATRSFQAIRIYINNELADLDRLLQSVLDLLAHGGRLVVISFHSLEDRRVKRFIRKLNKGDDFPPDLPIPVSMLQQQLKAVGKAVYPSEAEITANPRSRSAVMRVAERVIA